MFVSLNRTEGDATGAEKFTAAAMYGVASLAIMFVNKFVLTTYAFPSFNFVALVQFIAIVVTLRVQKSMGWVSFPDFNTRILKDVFPLPLLYFLNVLCGLGATKKLNMPMFVLLRRFSIVMTMGLEIVLLRKVFTHNVFVGVGLMITGAVVGALGDITIDATGYTMIILNDVFTALNGVVMRKKMDEKERLGTHGLMYYNTLFSLPVIFGLIVIQPSELAKLRNFGAGWANPSFLVMLFMSSIMGFVLNYSYFLCTKLNSALTTTVIGCLKNVLSTFAGMLFGDYIFSPLNFIGLNMSVFGSLVYSFAEYRKQMAQMAAKKPKNEGDEPLVVSSTNPQSGREAAQQPATHSAPSDGRAAGGYSRQGNQPGVSKLVILSGDGSSAAGRR